MDTSKCFRKVNHSKAVGEAESNCPVRRCDVNTTIIREISNFHQIFNDDFRKVILLIINITNIIDMTTFYKIAVVLAACAALHANASVITFKTGYSTAQSQTSADAYRTVVDAAVQSPTSGYGTKQYSTYTVKNSFGATQNLAMETLVNFDVAANQAGNWTFRIGGDFGYGAAVFIDNTVLTFSRNDMWWAESFSSPTQYLSGSVTLASGNHTLAVYGLENCCGGDQQGQFKIGAGQFTTFATGDGLGGSVPEPGTLASVLLGLGVLGGLRRRRAQRG